LLHISLYNPLYYIALQNDSYLHTNFYTYTYSHYPQQHIASPFSSSPPITTSDGMEYYQINTAGESILSMGLSASGESLCFGDSGGRLHACGCTYKPRVNFYSKPLEWPKPPPLRRPPLLLDDNEPLSIIPFPSSDFFLFFFFS
jgi:hypothetical protein